MDSSTQKSAADAKSMNDLFELVERKTIQLNEKDKELATKEQQIKELTANLNLVTARANEADELKVALATAESEKTGYQQTIQAYQTTFWKTFPFSDPCYYIKTTSGVQQKYHYLHVDSSCQLSSSGDQPIPCAGHFKFTKNPDGSFAIYSMVKEKYMRTRTDSRASSQPVFFCGDRNDNIAVKFVLFYHQQNQHPGFVVDIRSLANDCFLSVDNQNRVVANTHTVPANKFLIIPANEQ